MKPNERLRSSAPGRICLFGEHQDYLGLPVVPLAISLRIRIDAAFGTGPQAVVCLPDIGGAEEFPLDRELPYGVERDYLKSSANVLRRKGFTFSRGIQCTVRGEIPINSGTSSSSALIVAWINLLARMSDQERSLAPTEIAGLAHEAEVLEFGEPGGMMDHYSTACGGIVAIDFEPEVRVEPLPAQTGRFVLGDSREPKDTKGILARVKGGVLRLADALRARHPGFSLSGIGTADADRFGDELTPAEFTLLRGTIRNRDLTREARRLLASAGFDGKELGRLLNEHQEVLRDVLGISTPKIDRMLTSALRSGAYGGKINGSGGGGCMFVYAPEETGAVVRAIEREGGTAYVVQADAGTQCEVIE